MMTLGAAAMEHSRRYDKDITLWVICGTAGVGKSTFATELCRRAALCLIDIDPCVDILVRTGSQLGGYDPDDRDTDEYKKRWREAIHQQLFSVVKQQLHVARQSCVLIAPLTVERRREDFCSWLRAQTSILGTPIRLVLVQLWCSAAENIRRIRSRGLARDKMKFEDPKFEMGIRRNDMAFGEVEDALRRYEWFANRAESSGGSGSKRTHCFAVDITRVSQPQVEYGKLAAGLIGAIQSTPGEEHSQRPVAKL